MTRWLHPLLLAAAPVLFLAAHNPHETTAQTVLVALAGSVAGAAALLGLAYAGTRNLARAGLVASACVVLFHAYGRGFDALWDLEWDEERLFESSTVVHTILFALEAVALAVVVLLVRRSKEEPELLPRLLTAFGALFAGMSTFDIVQAGVEAPKVAAAATATEPRPEPLLSDDPAHPDVYFFILDGYARQDVLKRFYTFDNAPFVDALRARGFYVADQSRSTYAETFLSLTSTLSMRYLDEFKSDTATEMEQRPAVYDLLRNHEVARRFQQQGYRYVHFNTNFSATERMDHADIAYSYRPPLLQSEFMSVFVRTTLLRPFEPDVASMYHYMFDTVETVPDIDGPTFTFLHLLAPHNPYVFDASGNVRSNVPLTLQMQEKTGGWKEKAQYVEQLQYLNTRYLQIIDSILAKSKVPPIIILQSDHGSASSWDPKSKGKKRMRFWFERTGTLNAWYAPPSVQVRLTPKMLSVNTFRILLSELFGEDLPELEPHVYTSWYGAPYKFVDRVDTVDAAFDKAPPKVTTPTP